MRVEFPGKLLVDASDVLKRVNDRLAGALRLRRSKVGLDCLDALLVENLYFLAYLHPVHAFKNRLYEVDRGALSSFLRAEFDAERMTGLDIVVASLTMTTFIVGNHDGELFAAESAQPPSSGAMRQG